MGVDLGGHRLRNHRLPGAGGAVQQHALGWVDAEPSEEFGVLEGQLDHLTDLLQLLADAADVLVGDALGLTDFVLVDGFVFEHDLRVVRNAHDALGRGLEDRERQRFTEERHAGDEDPVAGHDRTLVEPAAGEAFDAWSKLDLLLVGHHRGEHELLAVLGVDLAHRHAVPQRHACVFPDDAIHADDVEFGVFRAAAPVDGGRGPLFALDFDHVTGLQVEAVLARDAGATVTHVGGNRLGDPQRNTVFVAHSITCGEPATPMFCG